MFFRRDARRTPWPSVARTGSERQTVGIVVVNFNTRRLIAHLIFSLYRLLGRDEFAQLVVVDNASTDGSPELLSALARAGLIHLIRNRHQRYHGPGLTQGISWLARRQRIVGPRERLDYVWVLDSDVVVLRPHTVRDALAVLERCDAVAVGQRMREPDYSRRLRYNRELLDPCSLLFDPARIWRSPIPPFIEDGEPATALQVVADQRRLCFAQFPFVEEGYLLHLGRGTLREVADAGDTINRYYNWAVDHREYHFAGRANGAQLYTAFCDLFDAEVGHVNPESVAEACRKSTLLTVE